MKKKMNPNIVSLKQILFWIAVFAVTIFLFNRSDTSKTITLDYSDFRARVERTEVSNLVIGTELIKGVVKEGDSVVNFQTVKVEDKDLVSDLMKKGIKFKAETDKSWIFSVLGNVGFILLFFLAWWFLLIRPQQGGGKGNPLSFGNTKAKLQVGSPDGTTFKDVAGCDEAKEELEDTITFLKNPKKFQKLGGKLPKGVLLYGAPGTGKTLLAKATAGEAGVAFFSASASEFVEMFVGVGASRVRDLFDKAKKMAPAIVYIDELDAVGRRRGAGIGGGHDEREQTLNQLLIELDGFESKQGIILMASTNRPDVLDPALIRPGRFDRHINVPAPDMKGREEILAVHSKRVKLAPSVKLKDIAKGTPGFVGADLANVVNEAAILAARFNKEAVTESDLEEAVERVMAGPQRRSRLISNKEKRIIAYHEAGHTVIAKKTDNSDPVHKVSVIPRGPALGYTMQLPLEDKFLTTKSEILDRLCVLLGGRAAEEIVFKEITTGAHDDLSRTTAYARRMVSELGMSEKLGPISVHTGEDEVFLGRDISRAKHSEELLRSIDEEVSQLVKGSYERAKDILVKNRMALDVLVDRLLEIEVVEAKEIDEILTDPAAYKLKLEEMRKAKEAQKIQPMDESVQEG
ncbi:ATP-dependent metalloprotease FtsH [Elusimicrobium minutum Pei191]|uniref:ATP-dependent zinc metalloprotease FtsH n=1 Tax=Elusimicrobium minutum (strain Pei191) TaxID=445932 RepID=B2KEC6_ELUMP|nr:ATP-dependent zinc metalloprotease FtsH [Elusimicrobium minutum]ACC98872.1 ATP-dependent metalloprotease FtsH [Elusimicrobium minutum Pei191]